MATRAQGYIRRSGDAEIRWTGDTRTDFLATGQLTGGEFALVDERASQGMTVPLHRHAEDVESFYVLEGEVTFFLSDTSGELVGRDGFVYIPAGETHGFRVESTAARYLILTTPNHGDFYRAITVAALPGGGKPDDTSTPGGAGEKYGIEFVGPLPD